MDCCYDSRLNFNQAKDKEELISMLEEENNLLIENFTREKDNLFKVKKILGVDFIQYIHMIIETLSGITFNDTKKNNHHFEQLKEKISLFFENYYNYNEINLLIIHNSINNLLITI